jgi:hypothetical protein
VSCGVLDGGFWGGKKSHFFRFIFKTEAIAKAKAKANAGILRSAQNDGPSTDSGECDSRDGLG